MRNKTVYYRTPKDEDHPYFMFDAQLWNLPNDEMLIMIAILSNRTEAQEGKQIWILNTTEIQKRLQKGGMGKSRFQKSMKELQRKGYLVKERLQASYSWKVYENPSYSLNTPVKTKIQRAPKPKEETVIANKNVVIPYEEMTERQKKIYNYNKSLEIAKSST